MQQGTYHPSVSKTRQVVYIFKAKELSTEEVVGRLKHESTEDIMKEQCILFRNHINFMVTIENSGIR